MGSGTLRWVDRSLLDRLVVGMLMVLVVGVPVRVLERLVPMLVLVTFGEVQPGADRHQDPRGDEARSHGLAEEKE